MPTTKRVKLKLNDRRYVSDPQKIFPEIAMHGEIVPAKAMIMGNVWLLTTWQACSEALRNSEDFVRDPKGAGKNRQMAIMRFMPRTIHRVAHNMLTKDRDEHRRLRSLVDQAFQRQSISDLESFIDQAVQSVMEEAERTAAGGGSVDLVAKLTRQVPMIVICEVLGLPQEDRHKFMEWFAGFASVSNLFGIFRLIPALKKTSRYLEEQFEIVRKQPREGLISALVQAEENGDRLSKEELLSMAMLLLLAGHETTVHLLGNAIYSLFEFPRLRELKLGDRASADKFTDEVLRYHSVLHMSKPRFVANDCVFRGQAMKRGELVLPMLACANYDPQQFDRPLEFIEDRSPNRHLMFGSGPHICLGMKLARAETASVIRAILKRWPGMTADFDLQRPDFGKRLGMRTFKTLKVKGIGR